MLNRLKRLYEDESAFRATLLVLIGVLGVGWLVSSLSDVLWPFLTAIILSALLNPVVMKFQSAKVPRSVATLILVCLFMVIICFVLIIVSFFIQKYFFTYGQQLPQAIGFLSDWIPQTLKELTTKLHLPLGMDEAKLRGFLSDSLGHLSEMVFRYAVSIYEGAKSLVGFFSFLFFVPIMTFYLLKDWPQLVAKTRECLPPAVLEFTDFALPNAKNALKNQVQGQLKVISVVFVMYSLGLLGIGVSSFLFLGFISGLLTLIPYVGILIAFLIAFVMAVSQGLSVWHCLAVGVLYFLGSSLESNFLTPRWVGAKLGLHPIWIFFAVLSLFSWLGMAGAFFVMPLTTLIWSLIQSTTQWFRDEPET